MIHTAIITAPRPRSTLAESIRSYRAAGFDNDVLVYSDGGEIVTADKVQFIQNEVRLGNKRNWIRALSSLVNGYPIKDDWVMVCEDDISWAVGAARDLEESLRDLHNRNALREAGALSLYAPARVTDRIDGKARLAGGWYHAGMQQGDKTWGAQCYLFSWSMAQTLISDRQFRELAADQRKDKNIDAIVGKCVNDRRLNIMYRIPCLVNHDLGEANSSLGYRDDRPSLRTKYFKGPRA
jgi:hypothetical protein